MSVLLKDFFFGNAFFAFYKIGVTFYECDNTGK
jgi:hypothetical protein